MNQLTTTKDWQFYETEILKSRDNLGKILKEYKESGTWKEHYKSWAAACVPFSVSKRWANELIQIEQGGGPPTLADKSTKKEQKALSQVEKSREYSPETEEKEDEEKPAVHSADEVKPKGAQAKAKVVEVTLDTSGHPIPKDLLPTWERRQDVQDLMTLASRLKSGIESIYKDSDPLFRGGVLNSQAHIATLNAIHYQLSQCKPGVVCPECNGDLKDDHGRECRTCRLTGFISESDWHQKYEKSNTSFIRAKVEARNGSARLPA